MFVPVLDKNNQPLMPCHPARARELLKKGRAIKRWIKGIFAIKLLDREGGETQPIVCGIDPGSKREGFTVKSESHTYLNIQSNTVDWVSKGLETRRVMRRNKRSRKTPYRKCRWNRARQKDWMPPSTKARWDLKLRIVNWLRKLYPITHYCVEDIAAITKQGKRTWNKSFSPLEVGKKYFYDKIKKLGQLTTMKGSETSRLRKSLQLNKSKKKLDDTFDAHCVDSWILANSIVGGHIKPDNTSFLKVIPLRWHRRQLHALQPTQGGIRRDYGSTRSIGLNRGSLVKHPKWGLSIVGGTSKGRITLHSIDTFDRLCRNTKSQDCQLLTILPWRYHRKDSDSPTP